MVGERQAWRRWGPGRRGVFQAWLLRVKDSDSWRGLWPGGGGFAIEAVSVFVGVTLVFMHDRACACACVCVCVCARACVHSHEPGTAVGVHSWVTHVSEGLHLCPQPRTEAYGGPGMAQPGPSWSPIPSPGQGWA